MNDVKYDVEITVKYCRRQVLNSADGLICVFVFLFDLYHFLVRFSGVKVTSYVMRKKEFNMN